MKEIKISLLKKGLGSDSFGIKNIELLSGGNQLELNDCGLEDESANRLKFKITSVMNLNNMKKREFLDFNYNALYSKYKDAITILSQSKNKNFQSLLKQLKLFKNNLELFYQLLETKYINVQNEKSKFGSSTQENNVEYNPLGTSKNPALSCEDIKTKYPSKKSG